MAPPNNNFNDDNATKPEIKNDDKKGEEKLMSWEAPKAQGLYDPQNEHDACGVGFIVSIDGNRSHKVCMSQLDLFTQIILKISIINYACCATP